MQRQPQVSYENSGMESNLEQASPWPELLSSGEFMHPGKPQYLAGREPEPDIPLNSPWLYLSLILLLLLLLL
jgi:hypothetical protein